MANLSIYQNLLKPPKSVQEYDDEHAARQVNMLGLKEKQNALASYERGLADESATREAYAQSAGDQSKVLQTLKAKGLYKPAMSIEKAMLDTQKTTSDIDKTKADTYKQKQEGLQKALDMSRSFVQGVSNPAEAAMYLKGLYAHPDLGPIISSIKPLEAGLASLPQDPQGLERWKAMHMGMTADKLMAITMPKIDNTNMGGYHSMGATDQFTGKRIETGQVLNTQSPDNAATQVTSLATNKANNDRMASEGAANRGVQVRGQNLTDGRARESNAASMSKPFEVTGPDGTPVLVRQDKQGNISRVEGYAPKAAADKPMTDAQSKAALFGTRMEAANDVLKGLAADKTTTSIPGARAGFGVGATLNVVSSENQQKLNQAKRDFVNAVLRRESGAVISDSEFENADKQYFPQVGDGEKVKAQKAANRDIAIRGIQAEIPKTHRGVVAEIKGGNKPVSPAGAKFLGFE